VEYEFKRYKESSQLQFEEAQEQAQDNADNLKDEIVDREKTIKKMQTEIDKANVKIAKTTGQFENSVRVYRDHLNKKQRLIRGELKEKTTQTHITKGVEDTVDRGTANDDREMDRRKTMQFATSQYETKKILMKAISQRFTKPKEEEEE
jgi:hypothetical protein